MSERIKGAVSLAIFFALVIATFCFSGQDGGESSNLSNSVTEKICETVITDFKEKPDAEQKAIVIDFDKYIRKTAHFSIYALMGASLYYGLIKLAAALMHKVGFSAVVCLILAALDEVHQLFVPGRTFMPTDILIDFIGSLVGIGLVRFVLWLCGQCKNRNLKGM